MYLFFKEKLAKEAKNTPYHESLTHILLMSKILRSEPGIDYSKFADRYHFYSDLEIADMNLLDDVSCPSELRFAINNVKSFLSRSLAPVSLASKGVFGGKGGYDGYIDSVKDGLSAWSDVLDECKDFVSGLEK